MASRRSPYPSPRTWAYPPITRLPPSLTQNPMGHQRHSHYECSNRHQPNLRPTNQVDGPVAVALDLGLGAAEKASDLLVFRNPRWRAAAVFASAASLSVGSAFLVAWVAFFLPVALALSAATMAALAMLAPPVLALGWVLACTGPACELLWRPLLVRERDGNIRDERGKLNAGESFVG